MWAEIPEENSFFDFLKGQAVIQTDSCFPDVFCPFNALCVKGRVSLIRSKESQLFIRQSL